MTLPDASWFFLPNQPTRRVFFFVSMVPLSWKGRVPSTVTTSLPLRPFGRTSRPRFGALPVAPRRGKSGGREVGRTPGGSEARTGMATRVGVNEPALTCMFFFFVCVFLLVSLFNNKEGGVLESRHP